jgi:hypothetical protein
MAQPSTQEMLLSFVPYLLTTLVFFLFVAVPISRRKGRGIGFAAWSLVPFFTPFILFYLVSLTDKEVLDRLAALEGKNSQ